jgi:hypothetical protein
MKLTRRYANQMPRQKMFETGINRQFNVLSEPGVSTSAYSDDGRNQTRKR